jgi:hypothetical protein
MTSMAHPEWADVIGHPVYPILLHESVTYLGRKAFERPASVGDPLILPLPGLDHRTDPGKVVFRDPQGSDLSVAPVRRNGQSVAEVSQTTQPGFYEATYRTGEMPLAAAVNVDADESDIRVLEPVALNRVFADTDVHVVPAADDVATAIRQSRVGRELWWELVLAGLVLLIIEAMLAWYFSRRMWLRTGETTK